MEFSIAIIARNGGKTLPTLFESLKHFIKAGGEVVLVDTGSTDNTREIAAAAGCKVFEKRFDVLIDLDDVATINQRLCVNNDAPILKLGDTYFNFAAARNFAAAQCSNDYVLAVDCDCIVRSLNWEKLNTIIKTNAADVYEGDYDFGGGLFLSCILAYNRKVAKYTGVCHEVLDGYKTHGIISDNIYKLQHRNDDKPRGQYLTALAHQWYYNQTDPRSTHYLGKLLFYSGRFFSAAEILSAHVKMADAWLPERSESAILTGHCLWRQKQAHCTEWWLLAFELYPHRRAPLIALAEFYKLHKNWTKVAAYASAALEIPWNTEYVNNINHYTHVAYGLRYLARYNSGADLKGAADDFFKAYEIAPDVYAGDKHLFEKKNNVMRKLFMN